MKLRVLQLIKSLGRGGAEMLLAEGLRFADRDRFEYSYAYFLPWKDAMVPRLVEQGARVDCFRASSNLAILLAAHRLADHLRRNGIDVLHCHLPIAGIVGRIAGRLAGVPVVYTEHNLHERYHLLTRKLNDLTWEMQDAVIAVSDTVRHSIRGRLGTSVPLHVILNGVDVDHFDRALHDGASIRHELGIPPGAPVTGTIAVFRVQKRLEDWVLAASRIRDVLPEARFLIVGDGPLRDAVTTAIARTGLEGAVFLPGLREDVRPYLGAMDVYMMSSIFEGLPVALLEAMSMGCAPVCTAVGGIPEVITDGSNGLLTPPEHPDDLAASAVVLLRDPTTRARMAAAARDVVVERFSLKRMVTELEAIYASVARTGVSVTPASTTS